MRERERNEGNGKNEGGKKVEEVATVGDKRGWKEGVEGGKKKGRREGGEACMAQQYTIINLTESV